MCEILIKMVKEEITYEKAGEEVRKQLSIEDESIEFFDLFAMFELNDFIGFYCYETDKLYKAEFTIVDEALASLDMIFVAEEQYADQYKYGRTLKEIITELENIFVGKTISEISEKYDAGELENWVKTNLTQITDMEVGMTTNRKNVWFKSLTWKDGEYELIITSKDKIIIPNTIRIFSGEDEVYNKVYIEVAE